MAQHRICLRLGMTPEAPLQWWREGEAGVQVSETPQALAQVCAGESAVVLAPAAAMLTLRAQVPAMPSQRLRQALPYALEEQFAGDVEGMHFAHGTRDGQGGVPVVAVEHKRMQLWLGLCEQAQLRPQAMYNEALSLPWQKGEWTLLLEPGQTLLRSGPESGYALEVGQWSQLLALGWEGRDAEVHTLRVYDARQSADAAPLPDLAGAEIKQEPCQHVLPLLCRDGGANPVDLLQGDYSRREKVGRLWMPWRTTAILLAVVLGLQLVLAVYDYLRLSHQDEALYAETFQLFRDTFPEIKNVSDPRVQMERELESLRKGGATSAFAVLLGRTGKALADTNGVSLLGLRYREGQLELELELESLPRLDQFKAQLEQHPLEVEVRSASARGDKVEASMLVREAGA